MIFFDGTYPILKLSSIKAEVDESGSSTLSSILVLSFLIDPSLQAKYRNHYSQRNVASADKDSQQSNYSIQIVKEFSDQIFQFSLGTQFFLGHF